MGLVPLQLLSVAYLIGSKPFEDPFFNRLEAFNEIVLLIITYHMIFFSDKNMDAKTKYLGGWSIDFMLVFQFLLNSVCHFGRWIGFAWMAVKAVAKRVRRWFSRLWKKPTVEI